MSTSLCKNKKAVGRPGALCLKELGRGRFLRRRFRAAAVWGQGDTVLVCWTSRRQNSVAPSGGRKGEQCCPAHPLKPSSAVAPMAHAIERQGERGGQESTSCLQSKTSCLPDKYDVWRRSEAPPQNRCACGQACGILMSRQDRLPSRPDMLSSRQELFSARQDMLP